MSASWKIKDYWGEERGEEREGGGERGDEREGGGVEEEGEERVEEEG